MTSTVYCRQDVPPVGVTVRNSAGRVGVVCEHIERPNRPLVIRVEFPGGAYGSYLPAALVEVVS